MLTQMTVDDSHVPGMLPRVWRFLYKPWAEKKKSLYFRWMSMFPELPAPLRLPFGAWWLVRRDNAGMPISQGEFEPGEIAFVTRLLKPGMTVLDVGAHHGLYTLLASKRVGPEGKVFAFEPATRERTALLQHSRLNRCKNVTVEAVALRGDNKPTQLSGKTRAVKLDDWLSDRKIAEVHFINLGVEGGELEVLRGAQALMNRSPRPVILVAVQEVRTLPSGHRGKDVINHLRDLGFELFKAKNDGSLMKLPGDQTEFVGNYVAVPSERESEVRELSLKNLPTASQTTASFDPTQDRPTTKEVNWEKAYDKLRTRWGAVPTNNKEFLSTSNLLQLSDQALLAKWEDSRRTITTGPEFGHRGWYHTLYAEFMRGKKVMDVGSGFGVDPVTFAQFGARMTFVDLVESNLQVLERLCKLMGLKDVQFVQLKDLDSLKPLDIDYDVIMGMGSLHNAPSQVMRPEYHELARHLKVGGRWLQLAYPKTRWIRDGKPPFDKWGAWTDPPGAPWEEWYDVPKLLSILQPFKFDVIIYQEIHDGHFNWFDLLYRGM